jgi:heme-degrading monooxygenase HmoA
MMRHIAQVNIGRLQYPRGHQRVAEFFANLNHINTMAEGTPGFVWRLQDETGNATALAWPGDPTMMLNMSVWESTQALKAFVWQTAHIKIYARKHEWFETMGTSPHFAMWWIEPGHIPTIAEAKTHLDHLATHGTSEFAFGWEGPH